MQVQEVSFDMVISSDKKTSVSGQSKLSPNFAELCEKTGEKNK